jgi:hypothetical protein
MYGAAAAAIAADDGPDQPSPVSPDSTEPYVDAVELNSAAKPRHAAAAANNGIEPGPEYIRPELISGGNAPKSMPSTSGRLTPARGETPASAPDRARLEPTAKSVLAVLLPGLS